MTEEEITKILSQLLVSNWKEALIYCCSIISGIALVAWFVARHWYAREIKHLAQKIQSRKELDNERTEIFNSRIEERNSYAKGIMQLADQRVSILEQEKNKLEEHVSAANIKLAEYSKVKIPHYTQSEFRDEDNIVTINSFSNKIKEFTRILHETDPNTSYINFDFDTKDIKLNKKSDYMIFIFKYNKVFESLSEELLKSKISEIKSEINTFHCQKYFYKGLADIVLPLSSNNEIDISKEEYIEKIKKELEKITKRHNK